MLRNGIKTVVVDFYIESLREVILRLDREDIIDLKYWLADPAGTPVWENKMASSSFDDMLKKYKADNKVDMPNHYYDEATSYLYFFINIANRWKPSTETSDYVHDFNLLLQIWYQIYTANDAELLLIGNAPHGPVPYMAYVVAKIMNLKVIITEQNYFAIDRFMCFSSLERIGYDYLHCDLNLPNENTIPLGGFGKTPFYMAPNTPKQLLYSGRFRISAAIIALLKWKNIKYQISKNGKLFFYRVGEKLGYRAIEKYLAKRFDTHRNDFCQPFDKEKKYVYFPLHLQPEMTTDTLGGVYEDQLLALERLSKLLPDDWKIFVKENPKQTYYKRSKRFFARLSCIDKVMLVSPRTSTFDLIKDAQFIATVTGSAGWEAITAGKKVLCFGYAWYRSLAGAIVYSENLTIDDICSYQFSDTEFKQSYDTFSKSMFPGIVAGSDFYDFNPEFSIKDNNDKVFLSLKQAILCYDER